MTTTSKYGNLCMSISSDKSIGSTFSLNSHVEPTSPVPKKATAGCAEETTLVSRTFTYKWNVVGYPFATSNICSEDFSPPDTFGDTWYMQLEPPKLRVEKGSNVDLTATGAISYSSVYSTSTEDMQTIATPQPPGRYAASGFEYFTDCRLSLLLKKRGDRSHNPLVASFEITLASSTSLSTNEPLHSWVGFAESFVPFADFPSKVISLRGRISDLVNTHKLTRLTLTCQLFYNNNKDSNCVSNHISNIKLNSSSEFLFSNIKGTNNNKDMDNYFDQEHHNLSHHHRESDSLLTSPRSSPNHAYEENNSLMSDLRKLFSDPKARRLGVDVTFVGVDGVVEAHRLLLIARSPVFRDAFENEIMNRSGETSSQIKVYGVPVKVLRPFVNFLYTDNLMAEEVKGINIELLLLADKYKIPKLRLLCEQSVARGLNEDNYNDILALSRIVKSNVIQRKLHEFFH